MPLFEKEATRFARPCEVGRTTISNYLSVLEATLMAHVIRPFSARRSTEIVAAPKAYGFDNELMAQLQSREIRYWRDKRGHEVDFILVRRNEIPLAIECKWSAETFAPQSLLAFRGQYPQGKNFMVAYDIDLTFTQTYNGVELRFVGLGELIAEIIGTTAGHSTG